MRDNSFWGLPDTRVDQAGIQNKDGTVEEGLRIPVEKQPRFDGNNSYQSNRDIYRVYY